MSKMNANGSSPSTEGGNYRREVSNRAAFLHREYPDWVSAAGVLIVLALWEGVSQSGLVPPLYLPAPSAILMTGVEMVTSGELTQNLLASLTRIGLGFLFGGTAGVLIGLLLGFSRLAESLGNPIVYSLYPIPKIALLPLFILWLGIGELSKVTMISLGIFFPMVINTYSGVKHVDPLLIRAAIGFKASRLSLIRKVILPSALPMIFAGMNVAAGAALILLIAAEMIAAKQGIGAMILRYGDLMMTTKLMVGVLTLSILGLLFNRSLHWLESRIVPWKRNG